MSGVSSVGSRNTLATTRAQGANFPPFDGKFKAEPSRADVASGKEPLRIGHKGELVGQIQDILMAQGFLSKEAVGKDRGFYGPKTRQAVYDFQMAKKLNPSDSLKGAVGPQTFAELQKLAKPTKPGDGFESKPVGEVGNIPKTGNAFIDKIAADAIRSQRETGVPASVTIAQAILESGWGKSGLSKNAHNYFGIKGEGPAGHVIMRTREVFNGKEVYIDAKFRKYHSPQESFTDHGRFLRDNRRYANAFNFTNDGKRFAQEIHKAGYATDPKYSQLLIKIMNEHGLERFDKVARGQ